MGADDITLPPQDSSNSDGSQLPQAPNAAPPSRLGSILSAVAKVATTGLASVPAHGRASFVNGLTEGARGAQAAEAQQQDIKYKDFDTQMRIAQLHNQDLAMQNHTQEQQDAHESHMQAMHANDGDWGIKYDTVANDGTAVMDHLKTQTAANGAAEVPPGTHISGDGKNILIPQNTPETQAGQLSQFKAVAPALGLNISVPDGATKLDPKVATVFYNKLQGYGPDGEPYTADKLPALIASNQARRDELAKQGAPKTQIDALDGIVSKQKAQLKADNDASESAANKASARKIAEQKASIDEKADTKTEKPVDPDWKPGVTSMQKNKTDLAENMVSNANSVASILIRRPELVGAIAGRYTSAKQMIGNDDKDIAALGTAIHNIAMANNGIHGMKAHEGVEDFEKLTLNHFKNGPQAIAGALGESAKSVQTFIDAARPEHYKTHSKNGGAIRSMVPQQ